MLQAAASAGPAGRRPTVRGPTVRALSAGQLPPAHRPALPRRQMRSAPAASTPASTPTAAAPLGGRFAGRRCFRRVGHRLRTAGRSRGVTGEGRYGGGCSGDGYGGGGFGLGRGRQQIRLEADGRRGRGKRLRWHGRRGSHGRGGLRRHRGRVRRRLRLRGVHPHARLHGGGFRGRYGPGRREPIRCRPGGRLLSPGHLLSSGRHLPPGRTRPRRGHGSRQYLRGLAGGRIEPPQRPQREQLHALGALLRAGVVEDLGGGRVEGKCPHGVRVRRLGRRPHPQPALGHLQYGVRRETVDTGREFGQTMDRRPMADRTGRHDLTAGLLAWQVAELPGERPPTGRAVGAHRVHVRQPGDRRTGDRQPAVDGDRPAQEVGQGLSQRLLRGGRHRTVAHEPHLTAVFLGYRVPKSRDVRQRQRGTVRVPQHHAQLRAVARHHARQPQTVHSVPEVVRRRAQPRPTRQRLADPQRPRSPGLVDHPVLPLRFRRAARVPVRRRVRPQPEPARFRVTAHEQRAVVDPHHFPGRDKYVGAEPVGQPLSGGHQLPGTAGDGHQTQATADTVVAAEPAGHRPPGGEGERGGHIHHHQPVVGVERQPLRPAPGPAAAPLIGPLRPHQHGVADGQALHGGRRGAEAPSRDPHVTALPCRGSKPPGPGRSVPRPTPFSAPATAPPVRIPGHPRSRRRRVDTSAADR